MDYNNSIKTDYLDLIFQGKNKQYGGYELRKKYTGRVLLAAFIGLGAMSLLFAATLIDRAQPVMEEDIIEIGPPVVIHPPPPPPPPLEKKVQPTTPGASTPVATQKITTPVIKPNDKVDKMDKMTALNPKDDLNVASQTKTGPKGDGMSDLGDPNGKPGGTPAGKDDAAIGKVDDVDVVKKQIEIKAAFKGNFNAFLAANLKYPSAAATEGISGKVQVQFVVNIDGSVSNIRVLGKGLGGGLNAEAIRVIKKSTGMWAAGTEKGKKYRSVFVQPITFQLN